MNYGMTVGSQLQATTRRWWRVSLYDWLLVFVASLFGAVRFAYGALRDGLAPLFQCQDMFQLEEGFVVGD